METTIDSILKSDIKICQPKNGFRFSVDSIILSRFVNLKKASNILDVGSGSGIISVLIAKLYDFKSIDAVELQPEMFECLKQSIFINKLESVINPINKDIKLFKPEKSYELIICNPPYRKKSSGRICETDLENTARFDDKMSLEDLLIFSRSYLKNLGYLYFSYDADLMAEAIFLAKKYNLEPKRLKLLYPNSESNAKLVFIECRKNSKVELKIESPLIQNISGEESEEFKKYFYL